MLGSRPLIVETPTACVLVFGDEPWHPIGRLLISTDPALPALEAWHGQLFSVAASIAPWFIAIDRSHSTQCCTTRAVMADEERLGSCQSLDVKLLTALRSLDDLPSSLTASSAVTVPARLRTGRVILQRTDHA